MKYKRKTVQEHGYYAPAPIKPKDESRNEGAQVTCVSSNTANYTTSSDGVAVCNSCERAVRLLKPNRRGVQYMAKHG